MGRFKLVTFIAIAVLVGLFLVADVPASSCKGGCGTQCEHKGACATHPKNAEGAKARMGAGGASAAKESNVSYGFLTSYFEIRDLLAQDEVKGLKKLSRNLLDDTKKFRKKLKKDKAPTEQLEALKDIEKATSAMKTDKLKSARESFKALSRQVFAYVESYGCDGPAYSFYCPMAKESWFQETDKIGNPYYGSEMLRCGKMTGHVKDRKYMAGKQKVKKGEHGEHGEHKHM